DDGPARKGEPRQLEPGLDGHVYSHVRRIRGDVHAQVIEVEALPRRLGEKDVSVVRRIERAAEQARAAHGSSNVSSPTSTSEPFRAPTARSASSSSTSSGGVPS